MSLIQDALKRKSEDPGEVPSSGGTNLPPADEAKGPKAPQIMTLILLLAVFLAAPIGFSLYLIKPKLRTAPPIVIEKPAPVIPIPEPVVVPEIPVQTTAVETVIAPVVIKEEPAPVIPIQWPELKLTGIAQSGNQSLAILNGKMLASGRKIGEVTIVEVREREVVVEYRGERRIMYIGE